MKKIVKSTLSIACALMLLGGTSSVMLAEPPPGAPADASVPREKNLSDMSAAEQKAKDEKKIEEKKMAKHKKESEKQNADAKRSPSATTDTASPSDDSKLKKETKPISKTESPSASSTDTKNQPTAGESSKDNKAPAN